MNSKLTEQTREQKLAALAKAYKARREKASLRVSIKNGETLPSEAISDPRWSRVPVHYVLASMPGVGNSMADLIMSNIGISQERRCGGMGPVQRERLIEWLQSHEGNATGNDSVG